MHFRIVKHFWLLAQQKLSPRKSNSIPIKRQIYASRPNHIFVLIGQDGVNKIKSIFWSEEDSTAKFYVREELEYLVQISKVYDSKTNQVT